MKENGKTIKHMDKELILMLMVLSILESGEMINKKVMVKKFGQMVPNIKDNILEVFIFMHFSFFSIIFFIKLFFLTKLFFERKKKGDKTLLT